MRHYLIHALEISGESDKLIAHVKGVRGKVKTWEEAKYLLDNFTSITELDKQCIINIAYRFSIINEN